MPVIPDTTWTANSTVPYADQSYQAGNRGAPSGDWELLSTEYATSKMTAEILNPRPTIEQGAASRYKYAHSQMDYEVPISVMGGAPPFYFTTTGVTGATVTATAPAFNPGAKSWGVLSIPAATVAAWSSTQTITVNVFDQENTLTPVTTVTWEIDKDDAQFLFLDSTVVTAGVGTFADPMKEINDYYLSSYNNATYVDMIVVYRAGTYALSRWDAGSPSTGHLYWDARYKPMGHIGFPSEVAIWDFAGISGQVESWDLYFNSGNDDWFFGNMQALNGDYQFAVTVSSDRVMLWDVDSIDIATPVGESDNRGFFSTLANPAPNRHDNISLCDIRIADMTNAAGENNGLGFLTYTVERLAVDGMVITNSQCSDAFYPKTENIRATITGCSVWPNATSTGRCFNLYNGDTSGGETDKIIQARYCRGDDQGDAFSSLSYGHGGDPWGTIYVDRSTMLMGNRVIGVGSGLAYLDESVIVNNNTPIVNANLSPTTTDTLEYTRAGSPLDADGEITGANKYLRGFEVRLPV